VNSTHPDNDATLPAPTPAHGALAGEAALPQSTFDLRQLPSTLQPSTTPDWPARAKQSREQQWALAQELLALGRRILARHGGQMSSSLAQVERILDLATRLARLATDLASHPADAETECPKCCAHRLEMEAAIRRAYGKYATSEDSSTSSQSAGGAIPSSSEI
jgi:hypothetical protein